jgi:hypothetical protein
VVNDARPETCVTPVGGIHVAKISDPVVLSLGSTVSGSHVPDGILRKMRTCCHLRAILPQKECSLQNK